MKSDYATPRLELKEMMFDELQGLNSIFSYTSQYYYDLEIIPQQGDLGWNIDLIRKKFTSPFKKHLEEKMADFYKSNALFYYVFLKSNDQQIGWIAIEHIKWNKTTRIWDIDLKHSYRNQGYGSEMMDFIKKQSAENHSRALVLECQTSNYPAIQFYCKMGFQLGGFDSIAYTNQDIEKHEVRLEMVCTTIEK